MFDTSWHLFKLRYTHLLDELTIQGELLGRGSTANDLIGAQEQRERRQKDLDQQEKTRATTELNNVLAWLDASKLDQEDELSGLLQRCHEGSCDWILDDQKIKS